MHETLRRNSSVVRIANGMLMRICTFVARAYVLACVGFFCAKVEFFMHSRVFRLIEYVMQCVLSK